MLASSTVIITKCIVKYLVLAIIIRIISINANVYLRERCKLNISKLTWFAILLNIVSTPSLAPFFVPFYFISHVLFSFLFLRKQSSSIIFCRVFYQYIRIVHKSSDGQIVNDRRMIKGTMPRNPQVALFL